MSELQDHKAIQKGFNAGYLMQQYNPTLAKTLCEGFADKDYPYAQGFVKGMEELEKEKTPTKAMAEPHRNFDVSKPSRHTQMKRKDKDMGDLDR